MFPQRHKTKDRIVHDRSKRKALPRGKTIRNRRKRLTQTFDVGAIADDVEELTERAAKVLGLPIHQACVPRAIIGMHAYQQLTGRRAIIQAGVFRILSPDPSDPTLNFTILCDGAERWRAGERHVWFADVEKQLIVDLSTRHAKTIVEQMPLIGDEIPHWRRDLPPRFVAIRAGKSHPRFAWQPNEEASLCAHRCAMELLPTLAEIGVIHA